MLNIIAIIFAIIFLGLTIDSLLSSHNGPLLTYAKCVFALIGIFLGIALLKKKQKIAAIICFGGLGFWLLLLLTRVLFS